MTSTVNSAIAHVLTTTMYPVLMPNMTILPPLPVYRACMNPSQTLPSAPYTSLMVMSAIALALIPHLL